MSTIKIGKKNYFAYGSRDSSDDETDPFCFLKLRKYGQVEFFLFKMFSLKEM